MPALTGTNESFILTKRELIEKSESEKAPIIQKSHLQT